jgi:hypothetical protein
MDKQELFDDWFSDNRTGLMSSFIERELTAEETERWEKYIKSEFERWRADK